MLNICSNFVKMQDVLTLFSQNIVVYMHALVFV